jgi:hypothetical protein
MSGPAAVVLGLALAVNWVWARTGGAIQSEPLYMLLGQGTILAAARAGGRTAPVLRDTMVLGALLAASLLTRQIAIGLAAAVLLEMTLRGWWRQALAIAAIAAMLVAPWLAWVAAVGPSSRTQFALLVQGDGTWVERIAGQLVFYVQRIPDQITGPFVEVGTAPGRLPRVAIAANGWAVVATAVIAGGWIRTLRRSRRWLAGMVALGTLAVLLVWPYREAGRFLIPLIPCILVGAVEGLTGLARGLGRIGGPGRRLRASRRRLVAAGLVLAASLPYSAYMLGAGRVRALEASQADFDAACRWLAAHPDRPGPVLTHHPGEVFWLTGRQALEVPTAERPGDVDADATAIARMIAAYRVAYLLIERQRYAGAPASPLARFVAEHPERVRRVWSDPSEHAMVMVYEVEPIGPSVP